MSAEAIVDWQIVDLFWSKKKNKQKKKQESGHLEMFKNWHSLHLLWNTASQAWHT